MINEFHYIKTISALVVMLVIALLGGLVPTRKKNKRLRTKNAIPEYPPPATDAGGLWPART